MPAPPWCVDVAPSLRGPLCAGEALLSSRKTWGPGRNSYLVPSPHIFLGFLARKRAAKVVGVPPIRGTMDITCRIVRHRLAARGVQVYML